MRISLWVLLCLAACGGGSTELSDVDCRDRPDDTTGYLQPICNFITTNFESYEIDPNDLEIEMVVSGDMEPFATAPLDTDEFDWVHLSCCFTGDIAVLQKADNTVVEFILGDV